jgi:hypothetical protein
VRNAFSGKASWMRISTASAPPNRKNAIAVATYHWPTMVLLTADQ